jgi:type III secretion protein J
VPRPHPAAALCLLAVLACSDEAVVHGLDERRANEVVVALEEAGVRSRKRREEGGEAPAWAITVAAGDGPAAQRVLAERELPRERPAGFAEVFGKGSMVPTPVEERALYLYALAGELARSVEAIDGVVEARVHLALPPDDALRGDRAPPPRAAVLVKTRAGARGRVEPLAPGVRELVAGAVAGLDPAVVSVVVAEAGALPVTPPRRAAARPALLVLSAAALLGALGVGGAGAFRALRRRRRPAP